MHKEIMKYYGQKGAYTQRGKFEYGSMPLGMFGAESSLRDKIMFKKN
jgi:hypothetical protein